MVDDQCSHLLSHTVIGVSHMANAGGICSPYDDVAAWDCRYVIGCPKATSSINWLKKFEGLNWHQTITTVITVRPSCTPSRC